MAADDVGAGMEALRHAVAEAASDPAAHPTLTLSYRRGHDLSGVTAFEMRADRRFSLDWSEPRTGGQLALQGELAPAQRDAVLSAVEREGLLDVPSSTRNIGDDELPILVELRGAGAEHRLQIWAGDARANPAFDRFEAAVRGVLREISDGRVGA